MIMPAFSLRVLGFTFAISRIEPKRRQISEKFYCPVYVEKE